MNESFNPLRRGIVIPTRGLAERLIPQLFSFNPLRRGIVIPTHAVTDDRTL